MAILQTTAPSRGGGGFTKQASLITLTFQNSAFILVMHYSRIMPPTSDHRYFTSTAVFLNELIKLAISLSLAMYDTSKTLAPSTPAIVLFEQVYNAVFAPADGWLLAIPGALYTLQNLLQYVAIGNLDAVQFQVLYQLKILTTALFSMVLLRRSLGLKRWLSLLILTVGVCVVSMPAGSGGGSLPGMSLFISDTTDHFFPRSLHELGQASPELYQPQSGNPQPIIDDSTQFTKRSATYEGITEDLLPPEPQMNYSLGVTAVLIAAAVSGLAGVSFEKLLKESPSQSSVWVRNIQLSLYSLVAALLGGVIYQDGEGILEHGFFEGYNWVVWSAVCLQSVGGLVASLVIRDADNIVKNFATSISIIISCVASMLIFGFTVSTQFVIGTSLVLLATYLYGVPERRLHAKRPPPVKIASFEKAAIAPIMTPRGGAATPRLGVPGFDPMTGRYALEPGLGLTSSRPSSPMLPRVPSRSNFNRED